MSREILVCCGTGCLANGSQAVADRFREAAAGLDVKVRPYVKKTGCNGFCENGPMVTVLPDHITYYKVRPEDAEDILKSLGGNAVERLLYKDDEGKPVLSREQNPFYSPQLKIALRNTGIVDPGSIDDYLERDGYKGLEKALALPQEAVIRELELSGLRGRGGAGFPTGRKWRSCYEVTSDTKYMICNGDEGDPGAFMDRSIMEGDPHSVLEGLVIGAYAIGAHQGFLYIRDEYGLALTYVQAAIDEARRRGYLGRNIRNSGFDFDCEIVRGGGAFVCGESSALMNSIEGKVGEPRVKYIRSVEKGLFDRPTVLNNVETLANVSYILFHGGGEYAKLGTEGSKGTKVFSLVGKVRRTGLVEVPMGVTLRELVFHIGGGIPHGRKFKAVQTGGPSGGCIPENLMDLQIDFDSLKANGSMMGSGGIIVMDDTTCMVELARYYVKFLSEESCGKCTPCREGLRCMLEILTRICEGNGELSDLDLLEELCETASLASLCELGKTAANPVMSTLAYFREEYIEHIVNKRCPAGVCTKLITFRIIPEKCKGCSLCAKSCPAEAITGELKKPYRIDGEACIKCGNCKAKCKFDAIVAE
jgi:NADH-quinone oxidoreductase subunit F